MANVDGSDDAQTLLKKTSISKNSSNIENSTKKSCMKHLLCPFCSLSIDSKSQFMQHMSSVHSDSLFAACKTCSQCFSTDEISSHVIACKGSFVCIYCRQTFALPSYLSRHIRRVHEFAGSQLMLSRFSCKFCKKTYSSSNALNGHVQKHIKHTCNLCGAATITLERTDSVPSSMGTTSTACDVCGSQSNGGRNGKRGGHKSIITHFNQIAKLPPYNCHYCQRMYVSLTCFRKHLSSHAPTSISRFEQPAPESNFENSLTDELCDILTEEDWLNTEVCTNLAASPNISLLHSILYEGSSAEL